MLGRMSFKADRHVPVRPNLNELIAQAKGLLRSYQDGDPAASAEWEKYHPLTEQFQHNERGKAKLADARLVLARSYGVVSWHRLKTACQLIDAIWENDISTVRRLVGKRPRLLTEDARAVEGNWGPPMSYAANLGRVEIIEALKALGADDVQYAFERACLQGQLETARRLYAMGARPVKGSVMGPCETLSGKGLEFQLSLGTKLCDAEGNKLAPVGLILETYCRNAEGKHFCLELVGAQGIVLPDSPPMAVHRGRIDLLERWLLRDPLLLTRTFSHSEIFPMELGCQLDETRALHGTPLAGGTLLHLCVEYDEFEMAEWLIAKGMDVNAPAAVSADGFGGHTALFGCVVSQTYRTNVRTDDSFARLLLNHGAHPNARASLRKRLRDVEDESWHEYHDVTPLQWGNRFHDQDWVNRDAMRLIAERRAAAAG